MKFLTHMRFLVKGLLIIAMVALMTAASILTFGFLMSQYPITSFSIFIILGAYVCGRDYA